ncbi:MAG: hypothetical protein HYX68_23325 [Planctomycetes bacterium]|nr:hypothetical protein [Planctomycetota bacterium]
MQQQTATVEAFYAAHGDPVLIDNRRYFADGAQCSRDGFVFLEPPGDDFERLTLSRKYWTEKLRRVRHDFERVKHALTGGRAVNSTTLNTPNLPTDGVAALRHLQAFARYFQGELRRIESEIEATPRMIAHRRNVEAQQQSEREAQRQQAELVATVNAITLDDDTMEDDDDAE